MGLLFEWDENKARRNLAKHDVSFEEASTAFADPFELTIPDPDHLEDEDRFISLGESDRGRLLVIAYTERGERIRIISARKASRREREQYEEGRQ